MFGFIKKVFVAAITFLNFNLLKCKLCRMYFNES